MSNKNSIAERQRPLVPQRPQRTPQQIREAGKTNTRNYRGRQRDEGVPNRRELAEAALQVLLTAGRLSEEGSEAWLLSSKMVSLLKSVRDSTGQRIYSDGGIAQRIRSTLASLDRLT